MEEVAAARLRLWLRGPVWEKPHRRSEEPHLVVLSDATFYCVWRTDQGYIGHATSRDGGESWSETDYLAYSPGGRQIKHPLACSSLWKCHNGNYLLWIHNHNGKTYAERNPAWVCGAVERNGTIQWSEPEILLYSDDISYDARTNARTKTAWICPLFAPREGCRRLPLGPVPLNKGRDSAASQPHFQGEEARWRGWSARKRPASRWAPQGMSVARFRDSSPQKQRQTASGGPLFYSPRQNELWLPTPLWTGRHLRGL